MMSLGGIAIAIGAMVDAAIVMVENAYRHLERLAARRAAPERAVIAACQRRGRSGAVLHPADHRRLFLPVFTLEGQEGRLFRPLAFTKTFAMAGAALLSITLVPVLMTLFVRGRIPSERANPLVRLMIGAYRPVIAAVMRWKRATVLLAVCSPVASYWRCGGNNLKEQPS